MFKRILFLGVKEISFVLFFSTTHFSPVTSKHKGANCSPIKRALTAGLPSGLFKYRIYSRISREILDKTLSIRLIRGSQFFCCCSKRVIINYLSFLRSLSKFKKKYNFEFWTIFGTYFFNSAYTWID